MLKSGGDGCSSTRRFRSTILFKNVVRVNSKHVLLTLYLLVFCDSMRDRCVDCLDVSIA